MNIPTLRWFAALVGACVLTLTQPKEAPTLEKARAALSVPSKLPTPTTVLPVAEPLPAGQPLPHEQFLVLPVALPEATPAVMTMPPVLPEELPAGPSVLPILLAEQQILQMGRSVVPTALPAAPVMQPIALNVAQPNPSVTALPGLTSDGYWIENAPVNEIFQYLSRSCQQQYFFNNELTGPEYNVTGHLKLDDPRRQMEDLAVVYGLTVYQQGTTVYLMTDAQLSRLPVEVMCYPLKYLRGAQPMAGASKAGSSGEEGGGQQDSGGSGAGLADFEKLKSIVKPLLSPGTGQIEFEEKNNVLLVTDNKVRLQKVGDLLEKIDRPKQQIVINVRILRVRKTHGSKTGVDWSGILGDGLPISASQSLNALFGLPDSATLTKTLLATRELTNSYSRARDIVRGGSTPSDVTTTNDTSTGSNTSTATNESFRGYTDGAGLVFGSLDMEAIVHALRAHDIVTQEACPTIITEDNEQGIISIVDRFPVITSNVVATTSGTNVTDEVRYKIDEEDPNSSDEPHKSREIGVTLSVTPTLLPDGTVRMRLRPRVANIVDFVTGKSGNVFPRVSESTIEGISRIPKGQSLFLGGFYDSSDDNNETKVPVLGSIPLLSRLFTYKDKGNQQFSLVFIITPRVYDASSPEALPAVNTQVRWNSGFNRTNPEGPSTPLLPEAGWENNYLPLPVEAPPTPSASQAPAPAKKRKREWFGWLHPNRQETAASSTTAMPQAVPVGSARPQRLPASR